MLYVRPPSQGDFHVARLEVPSFLALWVAASQAAAEGWWAFSRHSSVPCSSRQRGERLR